MKSTSSRPSAFLAVAGALLAAGASLHASETDDRIVASAPKSYVFRTYLKDDSIKIQSSSGMVVLTGTVAEASHKTLAEDTVEALPGVIDVDNQLAVLAPSPAEHSDAWLALKVKNALLFHRNVSASKTEVSAKDGTVTLRGGASSLAQKELTAAYAKDVQGVKAVNNEMVILMNAPKAFEAADETVGEQIDDASITAQVKVSLLSHYSTSAVKTSVETVQGVVTVSGMAQSAAEKSLVTKLVADVDGVTRVVNNMTITVAANG